ncbi:FUSC family protein [Novosphingobium sp.]|uniref:FUSC family protein n=1 Tax=Novosphingobium sp. TaxID=1874826 RepID=UPI003D0D4376
MVPGGRLFGGRDVRYGGAMQRAADTRPEWLARELAALVTPGPRLLDEVECIVSVLLAILIAHGIGATNVSWAAFSGYMVMRSHLSESMLRGVLRIIGTALGAAMALTLVPAVAGSTPLVSLVGALIGAATLYGALTGRNAYGWLFIGLTFEMILYGAVEHPGHALLPFAATRIAEVVAGTAACLIVNVVSQFTARRRWPVGTSPAPRLPGGWHPHAARHAAQAALALALIPWLWHAWHIPELAQSTVTVMAVLLVPMSSMGTHGFALVGRRLVYRIAGCLSGAVLAAVFLIAGRGHAVPLIVGTALGVFIGRHIENGRGDRAYIGTQFTLAILVTLVPDSYAIAEIGPARERLIGILIGMAVLVPVMGLWRVIWPGEAAPGAGQSGSLDA